jgi:DNA replication protein DnaC
MSGSIATQLQDSLRQLHLPTFRENCHAQGVLSDREGASYAQCLLTLCEMELTDRRERRIQRRRNASKLPLAKTLSAFDRGRLPKSVDRQLASLLEGDFLDGSKNVQWFGDLSPRTNPPSKLDLGPLTCPGKLYQA